MPLHVRLVEALAVSTILVMMSPAHGAASSEPSPAPAEPRGTQALTLTFGGVEYFHRWSKDGQNEFTPPSDTNLATWRDMVTVNVHEGVRNGDQLAELANRILSNYQSHGKILRTDSKPRTEKRPAEHLVVAVLGNPAFLETAFARFILIDGIGIVVVYSHRVYGKEAGPEMSQWLATNGPQAEKTLMTWDQVPPVAALKRLPRSK